MSTIETDLRIAHDQAVVTLAGSVDVSNAHRLGSLLRRLLSEGCVDVVIDLRQVSRLDAAGIGILRGTATSLARRTGGVLSYRNASAAVARALGEGGLRPRELTA